VTERALDRLLGDFASLSLDEVEERAPLLRRVDTKYLLSCDQLEALLRRLERDHDALEIDGRRRFRYRSVYFDTPDLRTFHDHVAGRRPRFKLRTRCYPDGGGCRFEVKVKTEEDETDKRQVDHPPEAPDRLGEDARRLVDEALSDAGTERVGDLNPVLRTEFERLTLVARDGTARVTCDLDLELERLPDGPRIRLRGDRVVLETKSEDGESAADVALAEQGVDPVSLSKYRTGVDLLVERDPSGETAQLKSLFR
jgi:hypothetical protein